MLFRVKPYENYVVLWPDSNMPKRVFPEGTIIDLKDISKDTQAHKLEKLTDEEIKELEKARIAEEKAAKAKKEKADANDKTQDETPLELPTNEGNANKTDEAALEAAKEKLRGK